MQTQHVDLMLNSFHGFPPLHHARRQRERSRQASDKTTVTVDLLWQDIIVSLVPIERVQFLPARILARGEICGDFSVMIPF